MVTTEDLKVRYSGSQLIENGELGFNVQVDKGFSGWGRNIVEGGKLVISRGLLRLPSCIKPNL